MLMKRLVAYLVPVVDLADSVEARFPELTPEQGEAGVVKVEAMLSDSDADRILASVAECQVNTSKQLFVTHFVDQELAIAGPHVHDLWMRIVSEVERQLICQVYAECGGVKTRAAARLGIDRNTLHKKLLQYDVIDANTDQLVAATDE